MLNDTNPVARQLRRSLLSYMASDCFQPRANTGAAKTEIS